MTEEKQINKRELLYNIIIDDWISNEVARISGAIKMELLFLPDEDKQTKTFGQFYRELQERGDIDLNIRTLEEAYGENGTKTWHLKDHLKTPGVEKLSDLIDETTADIIDNAQQTVDEMKALIEKHANGDIKIKEALNEIDAYAKKETSEYSKERDLDTGETDETRATKDRETSDRGQKTPEEEEREREAEIQAALKRMMLDRS